MEVVLATERAVRRVVQPDKINPASLGKCRPHLHWHVIPRWRDDSRFPRADLGRVANVPVPRIPIRRTRTAPGACRRIIPSGSKTMNFELPSTEANAARPSSMPSPARTGSSPSRSRNAVQAQSMFLRQLNLLHRFDLPADDRLAILEEAARGPVVDVRDAAKKFAAAVVAPRTARAGGARKARGLPWAHAGHGLALLRCAVRPAWWPGVVACPRRAAHPMRPIWKPPPGRRCLPSARCRYLPTGSGPVPRRAAARCRLLAEAQPAFAAAETSVSPVARSMTPVRHGSTSQCAFAAFAECHLLSTASPYELPARHLVCCSAGPAGGCCPAAHPA